ncbi:unnamed protein product [Urochloa humidicola]
MDPTKSFIWHWLPACGRSGGILCGFKIDNFDLVAWEEGEFSVQATVRDKKTNGILTLATVYGPAHDDKKEQFLTELAQICSNRTTPLIIGGDFNILRFGSEKNKKFEGSKMTDIFNLIINTYGLRDLDMVGGKYTWSNNQANPTLERLDRVLMNEAWEKVFPLTNLRKIPRSVSDHNPLLLCSDQGQKARNMQFCFETSWIKHHEFVPKIAEIWGEQVIAKNSTERWNIKIKRVKKFLKGWGQSLKGHNRKYKQILYDELGKLETLEEESCLSSWLLERKTFVQTEIQKSLEEEELYWHKRSNSNWLLKGDNNTYFFHKVANGKKRKNKIFSLQSNGEVIEEENKILEHATGYYKNLFGPSDCPIMEMDSNCWSEEEKINIEENEFLTREFSEEEIKKVIDTTKHNTAPGPDHIPIEFYQACWSIIKADLMSMFDEFHKNELDLRRLNYGTITLIPKNKDANKIQQYRPICLLNVVYKIFTKALMLRLEKCMHKIINPAQTAFIKGRNIMDGILILHEVLHDTKQRKKEGLVLKLDFEKAYDKISWKFLMDCLRNRGFSDKWCSWIWEVMTSGTLSVKVNDKMGKYFMCGKGVRQGDALSPLLFNIAVDTLAKMVRKAQENNLIEGLAPEYIDKGVAILQYADDTILCLKDDLEVARNTKLLLYVFEQMLGLKINFDKSEVIRVGEDEEKGRTSRTCLTVPWVFGPSNIWEYRCRAEGCI